MPAFPFNWARAISFEALLVVLAVLLLVQFAASRRASLLLQAVLAVGVVASLWIGAADLVAEARTINFCEVCRLRKQHCGGCEMAGLGHGMLALLLLGLSVVHIVASAIFAVQAKRDKRQASAVRD